MTDHVRKFTSVQALEVLGAAMRTARLNHEPSLRLEDVGNHDLAPRTWSHSHLSKVERGIEVPTAELVAFYETVTNTPAGQLMHLWEAATGKTYQPHPQQGQAKPGWIMERLEIELDLRPELPLLTHTRDLVANQDTNTYWIMYDTKELHLGVDGYEVHVNLGGVVVERELVPETTIEKARIDLGRVIHEGEWHRIRVVHTLPNREVPPFLDFAVRSIETREVLLTVRFPESYREPVVRFAHVYPEEIEIIRRLSESMEKAHPAHEEIFPDAHGVVSVRFLRPQAAFFYGVLWSSLSDSDSLS